MAVHLTCPSDVSHLAGLPRSCRQRSAGIVVVGFAVWIESLRLRWRPECQGIRRPSHLVFCGPFTRLHLFCLTWRMICKGFGEWQVRDRASEQSRWCTSLGLSRVTFSKPSNRKQATARSSKSKFGRRPKLHRHSQSRARRERWSGIDREVEGHGQLGAPRVARLAPV